MKIDLHTHILPKEWPDLRQVLDKRNTLTKIIPTDTCKEIVILQKESRFGALKVYGEDWIIGHLIVVTTSSFARRRHKKATIPDNLNDRYGYGDWVRLDHSCEGRCANMMKGDKFFRKVEPNCWSLEDRLADMDATNVDVQVLSTVPVMFSYSAKPEDTLDLCKILNNDIAESVKKYPDRFVGLGTLPMQAPELAVKELIRCKKELGFNGVQIGSHVNDWNLDAQELRPVFAAAEQYNVSIFVHPWDMEMGGRMSKYWLPWLVGMPSETSAAICCMTMGGIFEQFPKLKVCFAHGGGAFPFTVGRVEHGYNVRPDLCATDCKKSPRQFLGKFYTDALVHDPKALQLLLDVIGQDRVICGSDYPFPLGEHHPGKLIQQSDFPEDIKNKLLVDNACEFLGLDKSKFQRKS